MTLQGVIVIGVDLQKVFGRDQNFLFTAQDSLTGFSYLTTIHTVGSKGRLSSLLYSIATEPLALFILKDSSIKANRTSSDMHIKPAQYMHDIMITVKDEHDISRVIEVIQKYGWASMLVIRGQTQ